MYPKHGLGDDISVLLFELSLARAGLIEPYSSEFERLDSNVLLCVDAVSFLHVEKHLFIS